MSEPVVWEDLPSTATPLNAETLNQMQTYVGEQAALAETARVDAVQAAADAVAPTDAMIANALNTPGSASRVAADALYYYRPTLYETGNNSELVTTIPIATTAGAAVKQVIMSVPIGDLTTSQFITILAEYEVTNDTGKNVMIATQVIMAADATSTSGSEVTELNVAYNLTPDMHHGTITKVGTLRPGIAFTARYINVVAYATASTAVGGDVLTVEPDYGRLSVVKY